MLTRLYVNNYRCMANFDCQFAAKQLILGTNGAGKSTLFEVLELLRDFCVRGEPAVHPDSGDFRLVGATRTRWQGVATQTFELDVSGNGGTYTFHLEVDSWGDPALPRVVREDVDFAGQPIFRFELGEVRLFNDNHQEKVHYPFDWHRSALATITARGENKKLTWFKRWLGGLMCVSPDPRRMSAVAAQEIKLPSRDLSNFADWYRHLRQEMDDHNYFADLREVIRGFSAMRLEDAGERKREIKIRMHPLESAGAGKLFEHEFLFGELSDGQRVLIGLYAVLHFALAQRRESTVCFDEPDNFIALGEVLPWLEKVLNCVEDETSGAQVLIASHHPELLNRMAFEDGLLLDRPEGLNTRLRKFDDAAQTGLSPAELVARGWER